MCGQYSFFAGLCLLLLVYLQGIKHLMSGLKGSNDFLFLREPQMNIEGNIEGQGEKTQKLPWGQSFSVMLYLPCNSKIEDKNCKKSCCSSLGVGEF